MKLFSAKNPNYYIELIGDEINTQLLSLAIKDSSSKGIENELSSMISPESLTDFLLTFSIGHPYAKWLEQYLPFISMYVSNTEDDIKLPDYGYWKKNKFKLIEEPKELDEPVSLLRIKGGNVSEFVSFDVESTGVVPAVDRIIQIAAVKYRDNKVVDTFNTYVKPDNYHKKEGEFYISDSIVDITGIKDSDIKDAPSLPEVSKDFLKFIEGEVLVGHNLVFDIDIITCEFKRNGLALPKIEYYDTLVEARELMPFQPRGGYKLEALKEKIDMGHLDSHDALNDCYIAGELFIHLKGLN